MHIFADLLIAINAFVGFVCLLGCAAITGIHPGRWRIIGASVVMGISSLLVLTGVMEHRLLRIGVCLGCLALAYGRRPAKIWLRLLIAFCAVCSVFAGVMSGVVFLFSPQRIFAIDGAVYFDIPALWLVLLVSGGYGIVYVCALLSRRHTCKSVRVVVHQQGRLTGLIARLDTGNVLRDPYLGGPVIIVSNTAAKKIGCRQANIRVPCSHVGGDDMLRGFYTEGVDIFSSTGQKLYKGQKTLLCIGNLTSAEKFEALVPIQMCEGGPI